MALPQQSRLVCKSSYRLDPTQTRPVAVVLSWYTKPLDFTNDPSLLQETARQQFERVESGVYAAFSGAMQVP